MKIFYDPVVASDGITYEFSAVNKLTKSPMTRETFKKDSFNKSYLIRNLVEEFLKKYPEKIIDQYMPIFEYMESINEVIACIKQNNYDKLKYFVKFNFNNMTKTNVSNNSITKNILLYAKYEIVKHVIDNMISLEDTDSDGCRLIHYVTRYGSNKALKYLISKGVNVEARTSRSNSTPILFIVDHGSKKFKKKNLMTLHECGANIEARDRDGQRLIHIISAYGDLETLKFFVECGIDLNASRSSYSKNITPIEVVCKYNTLEMFKYMVEMGVKINIDILNNLLCIICYKNLYRHLKYLDDRFKLYSYKEKLNINEISITASKYASLDIIKYLIGIGICDVKLLTLENISTNSSLLYVDHQYLLKYCKYLIKKSN